ncbi:MAG: class I SAM-dependent methyltransferase [Myxococcales bacterium]
MTSRLLVELDAEWRVQLKQAPDLRQACREVWGTGEGQSLTPLRGLLGMVGAHEWRHRGVEVEAIGGRVHPHYGVFAPVRGEYVDLVAAAPLGKVSRAFDVGTGTGVLALVLACRAVPEVVATDLDPRAVACAQQNVERFHLEKQVRVEQRDLFPEGQADLVVFNPPWIPAKPRTPVERAIFDPDSELLLRFLRELPEHLAPGGEAWLVISNLAELLGLRPRGLVAQAASAANLTIRGQSSTPARHKKAKDEDDPLYPARSRELTTLYRIGHRGDG